MLGRLATGSPPGARRSGMPSSSARAQSFGSSERNWSSATLTATTGGSGCRARSS
jgi:hypothetical protein